MEGAVRQLEFEMKCIEGDAEYITRRSLGCFMDTDAYAGEKPDDGELDAMLVAAGGAQPSRPRIDFERFANADRLYDEYVEARAWKREEGEKGKEGARLGPEPGDTVAHPEWARDFREGRVCCRMTAPPPDPEWLLELDAARVKVNEARLVVDQVNADPVKKVEDEANKLSGSKPTAGDDLAAAEAELAAVEAKGPVEASATSAGTEGVQEEQAPDDVPRPGKYVLSEDGTAYVWLEDE